MHTPRNSSITSTDLSTRKRPRRELPVRMLEDAWEGKGRLTSKAGQEAGKCGKDTWQWEAPIVGSMGRIMMIDIAILVGHHSSVDRRTLQ